MELLSLIVVTCLWLSVRGEDYDLIQSASHSPCAFPTPQLANFSLVCSRYLQLNYLCDRDGVISRNGALEVHQGIQELQLFESGHNSMAIVLVRRIALPTEKKRFEQLKDITSLEGKCRQLATVFQPESNVLATSWTEAEARLYLEFYAETLRSRWFYKATCDRNFLILVASEGLFMGGLPVLDSPLITVAYGTVFTALIPQTAREETNRKASICLNSQPRVVTTILGVIKSIADGLRAKELTRPPHFIPQWAVVTVACCFVVVILLLFANWFFISRNTLKARKSQGSGDAKWKAGGFLAVMIKRKIESQT